MTCETRPLVPELAIGDQHARLQVYARPALADEGSPDPVAGRGALTWTSYYDFSARRRGWRVANEPAAGP